MTDTPPPPAPERTAPIVFQYISRWVRLAMLLPLGGGLFLVSYGLHYKYWAGKPPEMGIAEACFAFGGILLFISTLFLTLIWYRVLDRRRGTLRRRLGMFGLVGTKDVAIAPFTLVVIIRTSFKGHERFMLCLGGHKEPGGAGQYLTEFSRKDRALKTAQDISAYLELPVDDQSGG